MVLRFAVHFTSIAADLNRTGFPFPSLVARCARPPPAAEDAYTGNALLAVMQD